MNKVMKCPLCDNTFININDLYSHIDKEHSELLPEGYTPAQYVYFVRTKKEHGKCVVCGKSTGWNTQTNKYNRFCKDPKCKEAYREIFKERMIGKHGKITLLDDPEHQKLMLANRSISGTYKWTDGGMTTYTGSYEHDFLRMLDLLMDFSSEDIIAPSPHTFWYEYGGKKRFYIPDFYIPSLDLEIEVKDGRGNSNNHNKIQDVDKAKEKLKDIVMTSQNKFNYIKILNKEYDNFFTFLNKAKSDYINGVLSSPIFITESLDIDNSLVTIGNDDRMIPTHDGIVDAEGKWHSTINIDGSIYRERCEALIVKNNLVYLLIDDDGKYTIPGGSTEPNISMQSQLKNECIEEARINISTPRFISQYFNLFDDLSIKTQILYNGECNHLYVAEYHSDYIGDIDHRDIDNHMISNGKFYKIDDVIDTLSSHHRQALILYQNGVLESSTTPSTLMDRIAIPVFVLLMYTNTAMAKGIKMVTHQPFSHAGISTSSSLREILTFGRKNVTDNLGFTSEDLETGFLSEIKNTTKYSLYVTFFEPEQYKNLQSRIDKIKSDSKLYKYSYKGLINFAIGKDTYDEYKMFCSQFVADVISAADPKRLSRHTSRYSPTDLKKIKGMHFVTKGLLGNYDKSRVDSIVNNIKSSISNEDIINPIAESCYSINIDNFISENNIDISHSKFIKQYPVIESTQYEKDICLYIIIESSNNRLVNNNLNLFSSNDTNTHIHNTLEEKINGVSTFESTVYMNKNNNLVPIEENTTLPYTDDKIYTTLKLESTDRSTILFIHENFNKIKVNRSLSSFTSLDISSNDKIIEYGGMLLKSIGISEGVDIKRIR